MVRNYLKVAWRNLSRNKAYSFINILGLATGLATCILIMLYIFGERGYDTQHPDAARMFRIGSASQQLGSVANKPWAATSAPIAWGLKTDFPEVEEVTRLLKFPGLEKMLLKVDSGRYKKEFYETNGYYIDSTFFRLFSYGFKFGNEATALNQPNSIILSETVSKKLFGNEDPVGQVINVGIPYGNFNYTVKGVYKDAGIKSHIPAHFFLSMRNGDIGTWVDQQSNWVTNNIFFTYVKLKSGADEKAFTKKLQAFTERRAGSDMKALGVTRQLFVQSVPGIYLYSDLDGEIAPNGNATYLYILASIAAFVLLIACINFMNLSTARSGKRAREVGVRKVMGAARGSLILQFLGESVTLSVIALLAAAMIAWMVLPLFNQLTQKELRLFDYGSMWLFVVSLTIGTGLIAGIYPAFYLSSFRPVSVLKGALLNSLSAMAIRKGLVVFQFTISICLILGAFVIFRQLNYLDRQELGFNKTQQLVLPLQSQSARKNYELLRNELGHIPGVKSVSSGSTYPGIVNIEDMLYYPEGKTNKDVVDVHLAAVSDGYLETLGIKLLAGRGFSKEFTGDSNSIVLNEAALKEFGYDVKTAVGRKIIYDYQGRHQEMVIVGVARNFNFESLYNSIKPFGFNKALGDPYHYLVASIGGGDFSRVIKEAGGSWSKVNPDDPFSYSFIDQDFQRNYEKDQRASGIVLYFTVIAILVACLGLFGLSAFTAEQRTREIGIRKVLGGGTGHLAALLSKDFVKLVLIGILIGSPLAWYGMHRWLEGFAYRIEISWWMFLVAGLFAITIALLTVSIHALKAAMANPVKSLRSE